MGRSTSPWSDEKLERLLGNLLRIGVLLSAAVVLVGGIFYLAYQGTHIPHYRVFQGEPTGLRSVSGIIRDALGLQSQGVIQLGILILIATPIARVLFSVWAFSRERDRTYVLVTAGVFGLLLFSLLGGRL